MDTTPAQEEEDDLVRVKRVQLQQIQNTIEEALTWLGDFERNRIWLFSTHPDGDVITMDARIVFPRGHKFSMVYDYPLHVEDYCTCGVRH